MVDEAPDRLTIVAAEMAALAEELKTAGDNRRRREEIAMKLVLLGRLFLSGETRCDSGEEDR